MAIDVEIVPSTLPAPKLSNLKRFARLTNVNLINSMYKLYDGLEDDPTTRNLIGASTAIEMVKVLQKESVKNFHFYALNRRELSYAICHTLGVRPTQAG